MNISIIGTNGFLANAIADYFWARGVNLNMYGLEEPLHPYTTFTAINLMKEKPDYAILCKSDIIIYAVGAGIQSNLKEKIRLFLFDEHRNKLVFKEFINRLNFDLEP